MINFLRDPAWQFVGVVIGALALIIPSIAFLLQRSKKIVTFEVDTDPILNIDRTLKGRFEISFEGKKVDAAFLTIITLRNEGRTPVERKDFDEDISIDFGARRSYEKIEVLSCVATGSAPKILAEVVQNVVLIKPILINNDEEIELKVITGGDLPEPKLNVRINGAQFISKNKFDARISLKLRNLLVDSLPAIIGGAIALYVVKAAGFL